ncbi:ATP phosphoribosyltransferase regulatory subunit [Nisaea sp.]|uniref:ATP phosphoribosyltransferase regulatory subunit n=1 Tax=Nisaea sp. TaxID=2024842 RepID=UPI002B26D2BD|nr:ATP phosphoribosyltransferase regulatory subunit [Nisaea sp.]
MSHPDSESELTKRALLPAGLRDVLPLDAAHEAAIIEALLARCASHGYERVKPPLVEFETSLFAGPGAAMSDSTFRLMDPVSQKMMGVRADMTVQIARIATTRLKQEPRPLRLCYAGEVLRVSANQLNPERQLVQVGAELLGGDSVAADAEPVLLAVEALRSVGVTDLSVDLTAPRVIPILLAGSDLAADTLRSLRMAIDRKHTAEVRRLAGDLAPVLTQLMDAAGSWQDALGEMLDIELPEAARAAIDRVAAIARSVAEIEPDLAMTIDPVENRGFEYYTGFGFSLFARGVRGELGRGGRYQVDGGDGIGSTGFTLYMETVLQALPDPTRPERLYLPSGTAVDQARALREQGWITIAALDKDPDPALEASRLGCTHILKDGAPVAL